MTSCSNNLAIAVEVLQQVDCLYRYFLPNYSKGVESFQSIICSTVLNKYPALCICGG